MLTKLLGLREKYSHNTLMAFGALASALLLVMGPRSLLLVASFGFAITGLIPRLVESKGRPTPTRRKDAARVRCSRVGEI